MAEGGLLQSLCHKRAPAKARTQGCRRRSLQASSTNLVTQTMSTTSWILLLALVFLAAAAFWLWTPDKRRAELEALYLATPDDMIEVLGMKLHVRDSGPRSAPAVIMIHGIGSHLQSWDGWALALEEDYRVIRLDLPGSGLSHPDPSGDYTDRRSIEVLASLMQRLDVATANLIGNSLGGRIAWRFAASHPERVSKLVLVSPDGFASAGFEYGKAAEVPAIMAAMKHVLPKSTLRSNLEVAYSDRSRLTAETLDRYYDLMLAPDARDALLGRMRQTVLVDPEPILQTIRQPTLLLWGENDGMIPVSNAADYQRNLPDAELVRLPGLGHVPQEEAPDISIEPVKAFLQEGS